MRNYTYQQVIKIKLRNNGSYVFISDLCFKDNHRINYVLNSSKLEKNQDTYTFNYNVCESVLCSVVLFFVWCYAVEITNKHIP